MSTLTRESKPPRPADRPATIVSAVIPCLDEEAAIARVVTSVLAQDVREVVVVDGGSRDKTVDQATGSGARLPRAVRMALSNSDWLTGLVR